ncbi:uncharacterized protein TM35_000022120 [Trypanosoma theileri]|uniref:Uncharacterized protein n=1 Tax=Trypanosoma theileri TaxID=67003 RepID=A0A1X0P7F8_9TRYP|nr:uncharacterized protein TM35_000022120 [Trypanosoma theileri]ORC92886.1 hypothetical protein TM35_000022120 [Trypanosoma theileri]
MDYSLDYSEENREFLERVGVRELLESFVAEAVRQKPHNLYAFMQSWANARCRHPPSITPQQAALKIQCALRQYKARKLMKSRQQAVIAYGQKEQEKERYVRVQIEE